MGYKFVDATKLDTDLLSVAEAIRAKGGSSDKLEFPAGMVSAITQISTGVELNFEIIGGTSAPSVVPKENTIWVNTSAEITGYVLAAEQPADLTEGLVWIQTGASSGVAFNALKKNVLTVYPLQAMQVIGGSWQTVTAMSYQGGRWVSWWNGELYTPGNTYDGWMEVEMALNATNPQKGTLTVNAGSQSVKITQNTANAGKAYVYSKPIDLSKYNTLAFEGSLSALTGLAGPSASVNIWKELGTYQSDNLVASAHYTAANKNIPLDGINEECYIGVFLWHTGSYADITRLVLE